MTDIEITAYHEAAHCVAAALHGLPIADVTVLPNPTTDTLGWVNFGLTPPHWSDQHENRVAAVVYASGVWAQRYLYGDRNYTRGGTDARELLRIARAETGDESSAQRWVEIIDVHAGRFVYEQWHVVSALASLLLVHRKLDGKTVENYIHATMRLQKRQG